MVHPGANTFACKRTHTHTHAFTQTAATLMQKKKQLVGRYSSKLKVHPSFITAEIYWSFVKGMQLCSQMQTHALYVCMCFPSIPVPLITFLSPPPFSLFFFLHPHTHTPPKHPNHPASPDMWTQCSVHLCLSLSLCLLYFHPVCFHSPSFRVITWHLHCKVPCAALSSSAGDWASFPQQIRAREKGNKREERWIAAGCDVILACRIQEQWPGFIVADKLSGFEHAQDCLKFSHVRK